MHISQRGRAPPLELERERAASATWGAEHRMAPFTLIPPTTVLSLLFLLPQSQILQTEACHDTAIRPATPLRRSHHGHRRRDFPPRRQAGPRNRHSRG